jgi:hypothetical protein
MDKKYYKMMLELMSKIPPQNETPEGQKFHIGEIVKISRPQTWFSQRSVKEDKARLYQIQYSYKQQYGGDDIKSYSLNHLFEKNSSAWYNESELELVKGIEEIKEEKDLTEYSRLRAKYEKN